jgi:hypothetical protein
MNIQTYSRTLEAVLNGVYEKEQHPLRLMMSRIGAVRSYPNSRNWSTRIAKLANSAAPNSARMRRVPLKLFEKLYQIRLLSFSQSQRAYRVVMIDDRKQIFSAAIVEVRRMLPERSQRRGPVHAGGTAGGVFRFRPHLRG